MEHVDTLWLDNLGHLRHKGPVLLLVQNFGEPVIRGGTGEMCGCKLSHCALLGYGTVHSRCHVFYWVLHCAPKVTCAVLGLALCTQSSMCSTGLWHCALKVPCALLGYGTVHPRFHLPYWVMVLCIQGAMCCTGLWHCAPKCHVL